MRPGPSPFALLRANRARLASRVTPRRTLTDKYDLPPVPPLRTRLRGILPFLFWWSVITSLAANRLILRLRAEEEMGVVNAQISVLEKLVGRVRNGEVLSDAEVRKELELVGLRERTRLTETEAEMLERTRDVSWGEALLGRKEKGWAGAKGEVGDDEQDWAAVMKQVTEEPKAVDAPKSMAVAERRGSARRSPGASVYLG